MSDNSNSAGCPSARATTVSVDVVIITPRTHQLAVLLTSTPEARGREKWMIPWDGPAELETLDACAARIARGACNTAPTLLEQAVSIGDARRHPGAAAVSIGYLALLPLGSAGNSGSESESVWFPASELPTLTPRQRQIAESAVEALRARVDQRPLAFRLLPETFTLTELQSIYELLLRRRLHKASFRRALHAAQLVEATEEWRSEGRGRPAQLFRYAPRARRTGRRGVRFDLLPIHSG